MTEKESGSNIVRGYIEKTYSLVMRDSNCRLDKALRKATCPGVVKVSPTKEKGNILRRLKREEKIPSL